ncbi:MAG: hypothetical protein LBC46_02910, partial [Treponema sp.]|nr:hypothetical protein [Treponema sp.]
MSKKITVGILFGGKSAEHEVSLQSAKNVFDAIDKTKYEPLLIGISKNGRWLAPVPEMQAAVPETQAPVSDALAASLALQASVSDAQAPVAVSEIQVAMSDTQSPVSETQAAVPDA